MKQYKKPVALVAALALMVSLLAGCGGGSAALTAEEVMTQVQKNVQAAKSLSYQMSMDMEMKVRIGDQSQAVNMNMDMTVDLINSPMQLMADSTINMGELGSQSVQVYAEEADDAMMLYTSLDSGATWSSEAVDTQQALARYDAVEGLNMYMEMLKDVKEDGKETIDGIEATKYTCSIPNEDLTKVIEASGVLDTLSVSGVSTDNLGALLSDLGDLTFTMWVDTEKYLPVQYSFDMSSIMSKLMENMMAGLGAGADSTKIEISKTLIQMNVTGVDTVTTIARPTGIDA